MATILVLCPLTEHGRELINRLEQETGERPVIVDHGTADRAYYLDASGLGAMEAMLGHFDPDWRGHIARSTRESAPRYSPVLRRDSPELDSLSS